MFNQMLFQMQIAQRLATKVKALWYFILFKLWTCALLLKMKTMKCSKNMQFFILC